MLNITKGFPKTKKDLNQPQFPTISLSRCLIKNVTEMPHFKMFPIFNSPVQQGLLFQQAQRREGEAEALLGVLQGFLDPLGGFVFQG
ncbi:MAG: hypothetical protein LBD93_03685 [Treponema sp.]|jgi:hypothetical protein|nr:hypothetical protein [Treponema sp.]